MPLNICLEFSGGLVDVELGRFNPHVECLRGHSNQQPQAIKITINSINFFNLLSYGLSPIKGYQVGLQVVFAAFQPELAANFGAVEFNGSDG